jgi:hypothetical protein
MKAAIAALGILGRFAREHSRYDRGEQHADRPRAKQ